MVDTIGSRPKQFSNLDNDGNIAEVGSPLIVDQDGRNNYGPPTPVIPQIADGRLSLDSSDSTPTDEIDDADATIIYYVPHIGEMISLWDGVEWRYHDFSSIPSLVLDGSNDTDNNAIVINHVYDILIRAVDGTEVLELVAVDFDNHGAGTGARQSGKGLVRQSGVLVWEFDRTYRYLGTVRTIDNGGMVVCESSERRRFLWNFYNRVRTANHNGAYSNWSITSAHQSTLNEWGTDPDAPRFDYVVGVAELDPIEFSCASGVGQSAISGSAKRCGMGIHISMNTISNAAVDSIGAHVKMEVDTGEENPDSAFLWAELVGYNRASGTGSVVPGYGYIRLLWGTGGDALSSEAQLTYNSTSSPISNRNGRLCNFWY